MLRNAEVSLPFSSGSTAIQMVGTPAATVTFSSTISFGDAPGRTDRAPA